MTERKQHKKSNNKEAYSDGSKTTGSKVGFVAVFMDITRKEALPEKNLHSHSRNESNKDIQKRENMRWVIYTDS